MPQVTFEDRITEALHVAKTFRGSPAESYVAVLKTLGVHIDSAGHLDAIWSEYYIGQATDEIAALRAKVEDLTQALADHRPDF